MGCSLSAISNDEDDWNSFCKKAEINPRKWGMYTIEAEIAKKAYNEYNYTGVLLELYITHWQQTDALKAKQAEEFKNLKSALETIEKYKSSFDVSINK